jgi:hypothetical protein
VFVGEVMDVHFNDEAFTDVLGLLHRPVRPRDYTCHLPVQQTHHLCLVADYVRCLEVVGRQGLEP